MDTNIPNDIDNFRVSDYAIELFDINFKKINKTIRGFISPEDIVFKNEIKNQFFEFLLEENPWKNNNFKENTENAVRYYFNIMKSMKQ
jgi:hypothetical protein